MGGLIDNVPVQKKPIGDMTDEELKYLSNPVPGAKQPFTPDQALAELTGRQKRTSDIALSLDRAQTILTTKPKTMKSLLK